MSGKPNNYAGRNYKKKREPDRQSKKSRSSQMAKIRSTNTKLERDFFERLELILPERFTKHVRSIKGTPDMVFEKEKICVFLDSDFWHGWQYPRWRHLLKNDFWRSKIERNRERDKKTTRYLRNKGWKVIRIWGHNVNKNPDLEIARIINTMRKKSDTNRKERTDEKN